MLMCRYASKCCNYSYWGVGVATVFAIIQLLVKLTKGIRNCESKDLFENSGNIQSADDSNRNGMVPMLGDQSCRLALLFNDILSGMEQHQPEQILTAASAMISVPSQLQMATLHPMLPTNSYNFPICSIKPLIRLRLLWSPVGPTVLA